MFIVALLLLAVLAVLFAPAKLRSWVVAQSRALVRQAGPSFAALIVGVALSFSQAPAHADVPTGVETVFTTAATDFGTIVGYGWTLFLTIAGGMILFGIVRRVFHKSTTA